MWNGIMQFLGTMLAFVKDYWWLISFLVLTLVPILWGIYRARRQWRTREFMSRFSISLNILRHDDGRPVLWIPAAAEFELDEVFHRNKTAMSIVLKAAHATTPEEPFLVTIPEDDRRSILNEVANRVEVMAHEGSFAALAGLPVHYVNVVVGLSCEKGADVRIRKIRALVVEESLLRNIDRLNDVRFDKPHHAVRRQTLRHMARLYADKPDLFTRVPVALRIYVPGPASVPSGETAISSEQELSPAELTASPTP